jgi:hypothetical protein
LAKRTFFGWFRLLVLLAILSFVALNAWFDRALTTDWDLPLRVTVYPIASPGDSDVARYAARLTADDFADVARFFAQEAETYGVELEEPVRIRVSHAVQSAPPDRANDAGFLTTALWSLRMRWWAWRVAANDPLPPPDIQVFALYQQASPGVALPDSVGLAKGLLAIANLYAVATASGTNQIVVAHELMHTLGATDKYDLRSGFPLVPDGLGEPDQRPTFPQRYGEIMAGRVALAPDRAAMPDDLDDVVVGAATAREIGWSRP